MRRLSVTLSPNEAAAGFGYLIFQLMFLGPFLYVCNSLLHKPLSTTTLNIIAFILNFVVILLIFHRFLWNNLKNVFKNLWDTICWTLAGFGLFFLGNLLVSLLIVNVQPNYINANDTAVGQMVRQNFSLMALCTVILVPIVEETLYRGLVFGFLYRKNHILGFVVSTAFFAAVHVVGYVGQVAPVTIALSFLQYVPAGLCLAWTYVKTDSIWSCVVIHLLNNQLSILLSR